MKLTYILNQVFIFILMIGLLWLTGCANTIDSDQAYVREKTENVAAESEVHVTVEIN